MFKKAILLVIAILGIMFRFFRRRHSHDQTILGQDPEKKGDKSEHKDELDNTQAAEVVATWNLLNPP